MLLKLLKQYITVRTLGWKKEVCVSHSKNDMNLLGSFWNNEQFRQMTDEFVPIKDNWVKITVSLRQGYTSVAS